MGAGPSGLYAAYYAGFRALSVVVVDSLTEPGGQLAALYPEKAIYDVGGIPSILGRELAADLFRQAQTYHPDVPARAQRERTDQAGRRQHERRHRYGSHHSGEGDPEDGGDRHLHAKAAARRSRVRGRRRHVFSCRTRRSCATSDVLVVGGGDSAVDSALMLEEVCASVTVAHRRAEFRAHEASVREDAGVFDAHYDPYQVSALSGDGRVEAVELTDHDTGATEALEVDEVVAALGFIAELGPLTQWGMELHQRHIVVDTTMATSVPRIFAAGDITDYPGKVRLISVGLGEAPPR